MIRVPLSLPYFPAAASLKYSTFTSQVCSTAVDGEFVFDVPENTRLLEITANFEFSTPGPVYVELCTESPTFYDCPPEWDLVNNEPGQTIISVINPVAREYVILTYSSVTLPATGIAITGFVNLTAGTTTTTAQASPSAESASSVDELGTGAVVGIVLGCISLVGIICFAAIGALFYIRRGRAKVSGEPDSAFEDRPHKRSPAMANAMLTSGGSRPESAASDQIAFLSKQIQSRDLTFGERLAAGNFGEVWLGEWKGSKCVIKNLKDSSANARDDLIAEARQLAKLRSSPNICTFYGVCLDAELPCLVLELIPGGELKTLLYDHSKGISAAISSKWRTTLRAEWRFCTTKTCCIWT